MSKSRFALRIGGALVALLVALALLSCAEDSREPDDTSTVSDYTETSESSSSDTASSDIIEDSPETVDVYIVSSRSLTAATESYDTSYSSGDLYWTYTAVKQDGLFSTGQVTEETPLKTDDDGNPDKGLPTGSIGTFSVGKWLFSFYAYTPLTDDAENESAPWEYDEETETYSFSSDCLYYTAMDDAGTVSLSSSNSTIDVNVQLVKAIGDSGTLTITVKGFKNSDGTDADITSAYTLMYTLSDGTDTLYDEELTLGETTTLDDLDVGSYTLTVYLLTESGTLASQELSVQIRANLTTAVSGTLEESEDGTVSVYLGSYILSIDDDETYQYTYNEETGEYDSSLVYAVSAYCADEAYSTVYVTVDEGGNASFDLASITNGDMTLTSVTDENGDELYDSESTTITLTGNTSLYYVWTTDYTVSLSLTSLSYTGSTDTGSATYTVTLTSSGSDDDSSAISASSDEETISGETIAVDMTLSDVKTGVYTLTLTVLDEDGDYITLHDEDDSSTSYTQTVVINTACLDVELSFYPSQYLVFKTGTHSSSEHNLWRDIFMYLNSAGGSTKYGTVDEQWGSDNFIIFKRSSDTDSWTRTESSISDQWMNSTGTYFKVKLMDNYTFPIFHVSPGNFMIDINEIIELPTLAFSSTTPATSFGTGSYSLIAGSTYATPFGGSTSGLSDSYLVTIPEDLFKNNPQLSDANFLFQYATNLAEIPEGLFDYCPDITSFADTFLYCTSLTTIPENLFENQTEATNFAGTFGGCTGLTSIPENLFMYNTKVQYFGYSLLWGGVFQDCSNITEIPSGIFSHAKDAASFSYVFAGTGIESIDKDVFASNTEATVFYGVFSGCESLTSIPEDLFSNNTKATNFSSLFNECTSLEEIPEGIFKNNTAATYFGDTFANCTSLVSIPEDIFKYNVDADYFYETFYKCAALTEIPEGLFANNPKAGSSSFYQAFAYCTSLTSLPAGLFSSLTAVEEFKYTFKYCTGLTAIPDGLFKNLTTVTSYEQTFYGCTALTEIGSDVFSGNTSVTSFKNTFYGCSSLEALPSSLFKDCTSVTSFDSTFYNCTALTSVPESLFDNNTAVTSFNQLFYNCTSLDSVDSELFIYNTKVTNFKSTFRGCSSLSLTLYIGTESLSSKSYAQYFAYGNAATATVYTKSSTIAEYFNDATNSNVSATADTPEDFSWPE